MLIEEPFDILVDNYIEFETTLLYSSLTNLVRSKSDYQELHAERRLFNRRLMNFLTTAQSYIDQTLHYISELFGDKSQNYIDLQMLINKKHDECFSYKVMDSLRNHVQHRGWAIHSTTYNSRLIGDIKTTNGKFKNKIRYTITPNLMIQHIENDKKISRKVVSELKEMGNDVDIRPLVREYVESLAEIHSELRKSLKNHITKWDETILNTINRVQKENTGDIPIFIELVIEENGQVVKATPIIKQIIESREYLEKKNRNLANLKARYVTNELAGEDS